MVLTMVAMVHCKNFNSDFVQRVKIEKLRVVNLLNMGTGCGTFGRAVASFIRDPLFETGHQ